MSILNRFTLSALVGSVMALSLTTSASAQTAGVKNVVLIHGAFADGSSYAKIIPLLEAQGLHVVAVQNPLTSLADDVAAAKRAIALQDGPVLLVGHSWGGVVITEAGNDPKVAGLLYIAAAAPDAGQSFGEMAKAAPTPPGIGEAKPDAAGYLSLTEKGVTEYFAPDVSKAEAKVIFATQGPWNSKAVGDKVTTAAWQTKPSWYIVASDDRMIDPTLAKKIKATTLVLKSSHVPMVSQPDKVAAFIIDAAKKVSVK